MPVRRSPAPLGGRAPVPIRSDLKHFYGRIWQTITRPRILARAGNKCERCSKPNHALIETRLCPGSFGSRMFVRWVEAVEPCQCELCKQFPTPKPDPEQWYDDQGRPTTPPRHYKAERKTKVVVCLGHLNHQAGDDRDDNLKAWCQWCHLKHDQTKHKTAAKDTRIERKDSGRPLLHL